MKFQNPSMHGSWTDGRTHNPKPICPINFFEVGGIEKHNNLDASDRKQRFRTDGWLPPAAVPDDPIAQTVGDILQRRLNPLPNPHDKTHPFLVS